MSLTIEIRGSLDEVAPEAWSALVGDGCPFFEHAFLHGLELTGCVGPDTGWRPRYALVRRGRELVGALPLYRKDDSYGEFVFDWGWAEAAQRAGLPYYPKLVVAAPFSPVGGRRFLLAPGEGEPVMEALLHGAREAARQEPATGVHWLLVTPDEADFLEARGLAIRHTHQFHWHDQGYSCFDDFLGRFRSKRRNQIRRERRVVREQGVQIRVLDADRIGPAEIEHAWRFYLSTVRKFYWGRTYLNRAFFEHLGQHWAGPGKAARLMLVLACRDEEVVAGALNVRKGDHLYGRYWGCDEGPGVERLRNLHFEVCSYAGIEASIARGIRVFEAGAGGGQHKFGRGFLPTRTYSVHEIYLPGLDDAVRRFLEHEREALASELEAVAGQVLKPDGD